MFLAWRDPTHAGRLSRLFKHKQATAEKRDGSRDDCKRLTAVTFFFLHLLFFQLMITSLIPTRTEQIRDYLLKLYISEYVNSTFRINAARIQGRKVHIPPTDSYAS